MKQETSLKNMSGMRSLLMSLSPECADYDTTNEDKIIESFVNYYQDKKDIVRILTEGRQVLALEPFPWEWVQSAYESRVFDAEIGKWVEDPVIYHKWLQGILLKLEEEAKKQGKLP